MNTTFPKLLDLTSDILVNATDYIGNKPEYYNASNYDLDVMRNNFSFQEYLNDVVADDEFDWDTNHQELCADYVWEHYMKWQS